MHVVAYRNFPGLLAAKSISFGVSGEKHLATVSQLSGHGVVGPYVPIGLYCELSSLLDNSETFVTFYKTKLA